MTNPRPQRIRHQCDHCGHVAMRAVVGVCRVCGGWYRQMSAIVGDVTPFPCLVREWPIGSFSVAMLTLDKASGDLVPLDEWPIRNVSEAEARAVLERAK